MSLFFCLSNFFPAPFFRKSFTCTNINKCVIDTFVIIFAVVVLSSPVRDAIVVIVC